MHNKTISTNNAPEAIGAYSQAVRAGNTVYISGQIPLDPTTMQVVQGGFIEQTHQVFKNLQAVIDAAEASSSDAVKLTVYVTDLANFASLNDIMAEYFSTPFPARAAVQVAALPKGVQVEIDAILVTE